jgi:hypothetical protein
MSAQNSSPVIYFVDKHHHVLLFAVLGLVARVLLWERCDPGTLSTVNPVFTYAD